MRKILLLVLLLSFLPFVANSQDYATIKAEYKFAKKQERQERQKEWESQIVKEKNQLRLGLGFHRSDDYYAIPMFGLEYTYQVHDFLEVGGSISYGNYYVAYEGYSSSYGSRCLGSYYPNSSASALKTLDQLVFGASLYARYSWLNLTWISFYSTLGVNYLYEKVDSFYYSGFSSSTSGWFIEHSPAMIEIIPIGVRVGRKVFGYLEPIGFSNRGYYMMFGVGVMF